MSFPCIQQWQIHQYLLALRITVIDLCSAFFSIPIHKESQFLFAFTFNGNQNIWTRALQGYTESPTLYSRALHHDLRDVQLPAGSVLVQYMDDLLVASPSKEACERDSIALLIMPEKKGHKASLTKLQFCQSQVKYLGHILKGTQKLLCQDIIKALTTKSDMMSFLGAANYCRQWISEYAMLDRPLRDVLPQTHLTLLYGPPH